ncbi:MAG: prolipoprotein diacylglyceryl transferase [Bacteroidales bacterium]|nr:prolipoprotein diacylglyceryl transferase [Bacteroidales bacterium]
MILNFIVWNPTPEIFELTIPGIGTIAPRWYGLLFAMGFVVGYIIMLKVFRKERIPVKVLDQLATYMIIATIIGARLGHVLFYQPVYYFKNPIEILMVWKGGLASHGAAIAIIIALLIFSKRNHKPFIWIFDRISIVVALAAAFIRTGNLMNSEIFGVKTSLPWGFKFVNTDPSLVAKHPTQIYEALAYLGIFIFLWLVYLKRNGRPRPGFLSAMFMILVFTFRFFIEFLKEPQVDFEVGMALNMGQLLSIPFVLLGVGTLLYIYRKKTIRKKQKLSDIKGQADK